jgi:twinkle protein
MADVNQSIARIDAYRARHMGEMLVKGELNETFMAEPDMLIDISGMDGAALLAEFDAFESKFATAPFDPEGHLLRFYPGGVSVWSGYPGAGKTTVLRQLICHTLHRGSSIFHVSLEENPRMIPVRLASTAAGVQRANAHQIQWFIDAYQKRYRLWGRIGIAQHLKILGLVRQLAEQGIRHVILDSLMCLDIKNDDTEAQRRFVNLLANTARASDIHIHLVAHPRKLQSSEQELDMNDVAGAREIGGIADNVIFIRRTKAKDGYLQNAEVTPMCISVRKQRHHNGALGDIEGWYQRNYRQWSREQFVNGPMRYLPDDAFQSIRNSRPFP